MTTLKVSSHTRSTSFPSTSNRLFETVEANLERIRSFEAASSSSSHEQLNGEQLNGLKKLYESLDDVLQMKISQHALPIEKTEQVLDGSIRLLDICGSIKDCFSQMKEGVKKLESSLRRRRGVESGLGDEIAVYMRSKKRLQKMVSSCLKDIKKTEKLKKDTDMEPLLNLLNETQQISCRVLESIVSSIAQSKATSKSWSLVSKILLSKQVSNEGEATMESELQLLIQNKSNSIHMQNVLKQSKKLESNIDEVEETLEGIYRILLKTRVSLLNTLN